MQCYWRASLARYGAIPITRITAAEAKADFGHWRVHKIVGGGTFQARAELHRTHLARLAYPFERYEALVLVALEISKEHVGLELALQAAQHYCLVCIPMHSKRQTT